MIREEEFRRHRLTVSGDDAGGRIDQVLASLTPYSRTRVRDFIDFGAVYRNRRICRRLSQTLSAGDEVTLYVPSRGTRRFYESDPARILFDQAGLIAYDKEPGIPSQQVPYDAYNNVFFALRRHLFSGSGDYLALHHRLDQGTSGVILLCRDRRLNARLARLFRERRIEKNYIALVCGSPPEDQWVVDLRITRLKGRYACTSGGPGKEAVTEFTCLDRADEVALVRARPLTGRTHQIRLHLASCGMPVLGDRRYGGKSAERLMLHAEGLSLVHPGTGEAVRIEAPVPREWRERVGL